VPSAGLIGIDSSIETSGFPIWQSGYAILRIGVTNATAYFTTRISVWILRTLRNLSATFRVECAVGRERLGASGLILIPGQTSSSIFLSKGKGFPKTA
jgi:hypothetical protein